MAPTSAVALSSRAWARCGFHVLGGHGAGAEHGAHRIIGADVVATGEEVRRGRRHDDYRHGALGEGVLAEVMMAGAGGQGEHGERARQRRAARHGNDDVDDRMFVLARDGSGGARPDRPRVAIRRTTAAGGRERRTAEC